MTTEAVAVSVASIARYTNMSKAVRWQVPFVSVSGTKYRVDIYDDTGSWSGVTQLLPGDQPFVTDEDASDDYFAPVRSQSGTLQVCTKIEPQTTYPSGGMLSLNDILPANNIAHPVRLVSIAANNAETIEWQGFLSCEAYSQNYTAIPENLSLPIIGVLEAMDSVFVDTTNFNGAMRGNNLLYQCLYRVQVACGLEMFMEVAYSNTAWRILLKYFDTAIFFNIKEHVNENTVTYDVSGISCKELLNRICTYMGWTAREQGRTLYLHRLGEDIGMYVQTLTNLNDSNFSDMRTALSLTTADMANCEWRGVDHKRDIRQGARSVGVEASIDDFDADMNLPDFPNSNPTTAYIRQVDNKEGSTRVNKYVENFLESDNNANSRCSFAYHYGYCFRLNGGTPTYRYDGISNQADFMSNAFLRGGLFSRINSGDNHTFYAGASLIRYYAKNSQGATVESYDQGLYCTFLPGIVMPSITPIFRMRNPRPVSLYKGTINIKAETIFMGVVATRQWLSYQAYQSTYAQFDYHPVLSLKLRIGDRYYTGNTLDLWSTTEQPFITTMKDNGIDITIQVPNILFGEMELSIMPYISEGPLTGANESQVMELLFKSLNVTYTPDTSAILIDRSKNSYFRTLSTNFRDEISINTDIASFMNNVPSPSIIMNDPSDNTVARFMTVLSYNRSGYQITRRPEVDLLNRLAAYYGAARQRLELEVAHPTAAPLPLLKLNGINDGKVYLPLSESRDWQTGVCKLTCFETPT